MKYRIIEKDGKFYAQSKFLWVFWITWYDFRECDIAFKSYEEARDAINEQITKKNHKKLPPTIHPYP